jgi:hypothetical protein
MEENNSIVWQSNELAILPKKITTPELVSHGVLLSSKDQKQIITAFENGSYEMVATYIWTKTINSLKNQLSKMGLSFISEMLDRPDINEHTNLQQAISDYEAIRLAEELGVINGTGAFRLRQAMDTVVHFNQPDFDNDNFDNELTEEETKTIIRSCVQGVLRYNKIAAPIDFKNFRQELEETTLNEENSFILKLIHSPYFFHRTTIRILLSLVKSSSGAQLENSLANSNLIIPKIWNGLQHPEKYQIGRSYSELFADGQTKAASGLKQVLLKVKGFDFVPEDLRSTSFIKIANGILRAHDGMNNFYNEPAPINTLAKMGSVIPSPAFPICMTAILSVKLGNAWGISNAAQDSANVLLKNVTHDRWVYFFNECLPTNDRLLYKLVQSSPSTRWIHYFSTSITDEILSEIKNRKVIQLLKATQERSLDRLQRVANDLYSSIGYTNK